MSADWYIEDEKTARIKITEENGQDITPTAVFEVFDKDGNSIQGEAAASISGSGTAEVIAEGLVEATVANGFAAGESYEVWFIVTIGTWIASHCYDIDRLKSRP